jgi:hypothetical protein
MKKEGKKMNKEGKDGEAFVTIGKLSANSCYG